VIGKNNQLIGYAGKQIDKKAILLELEKTSLFMMV
jgi:methylated-DNA-[protein]-cysteine S-methyltransferase